MLTTKDVTIRGFKIDLLTHNNYSTWKDRARAILRIQLYHATKLPQWTYVGLITQWDNLKEVDREPYKDLKDLLCLMISKDV
jgi:hypothetical protein